MWWKSVTDWIRKAKTGIKQVLFPFICIYFIRTLIMPTVIDVIILFFLFLIYLGAHLDWF